MLSIGGMASAQEEGRLKLMEVGLRLMPTFSDIKMKTASGGEVSGNAVLGFGIGGFIGFHFSNYIGVQGEFIYSSINQETSDNNINRRVNLRYVNIPLLLSLNTGTNRMVNLNLVAGPQMGFQTGSSLSLSGANDPNNPQPILSVKKSDIGFAYGAGVDFGLNPMRTIRLGMGYRGVFGLLDVSDRSKTTSDNTYYVFDKAHVRTHSGYVALSIRF
jgi:opacity protein-like surface antigen